ncbi:MAG: hypothetical protein IJ899_11790 [Blautia sp.]|nr:hypothetical protein [Blautia sp.]
MKQLMISPVEMTREVMMDLEARGLIIRLCPNHEQFDAPKGETTWQLMYEPKEDYGPHRLISIRVNREAFAGFGTNPDNEEFWCIGDADTQPMYLAIALIDKETLNDRIQSDTLSESDFVMLRVRYNDPEVSFFVMRAEVPHGEAIVDHGRPPAAFYVTENRDLPLELTDFGNYNLTVRE